MREEPAVDPQDEDAAPVATSAPETAIADADVDELGPNGGGTSGNHGNGTAG